MEDGARKNTIDEIKALSDKWDGYADLALCMPRACLIFPTDK